MDTQQIITIALAAVAAYFLLKHVWKDLEGVFRPTKAGHCDSCGMCGTGKTSGTRAAPEIKTRELITLQPKLPPHLERIRAQKEEARAGSGQ
jgi:hypothetical protein